MSLASGTIDLTHDDIQIRNYIFEETKKILELRGVIQLETPVLEKESTVQNLYGGEFNKLVYELEDGFNKLILRYDFTVPLARYVGTHNIQKLKRYQYGRVYRRDTPQINKGRLREFYQLDYDIIGDDQGSHQYDLEILETLHTILEKLLNKSFIIKINIKSIVIALFNKLNIDESIHKDIFISIDKLDKCSFSDIKQELYQKKLTESQVDKLEEFYNKYINIQTNDEIINQLKLDLDKIIDNNTLTELDIIFNFLNKLEIQNNFKLNPFLIRGMDYYTGLLFEVVYLDNSNIMNLTIAAGGRYDKMIGKFCSRGDIPAIGMSLGVDRIAQILKNKNIIQTKPYDIYVATIGVNIIERLSLCNELRKHNYKVLTSELKNPKMKHHFDNVFNNDIKIMIIIGDNEIKDNLVCIKDIKNKIEYKIDRNQMYEKINDILNNDI